MSYSRYQFFPDVWNDEIQHTQKGLLDLESLKEKLTEENIELYEIPLNYNYRPDLIARDKYGSERLYWVLAYINNINDSPFGFYTGRVIKIPSKKRVLELV